MKKLFLPGTLFLITIFSLYAQTTPLSSSLFNQKDKEEETYQCIQIRRGDKITLSGTLSMYETGDNLKYLMLSSDGGRIFLLKGELIPDLNQFFLLYNKTEKITLSGTILFPGLDKRPAELDVYSYQPSKEN